VNQPSKSNVFPNEERQRLEARHTFQRIVELRLRPVEGHFDADHLREINRRIFQDLPGLGFSDVTPGEYRPVVPLEHDWIKVRQLESIKVSSHVAYSRMDTDSVAQLEKTLKSIDLTSLIIFKTEKFTRFLGNLYVELDYIHPFSDGNSRSLREFTRQLATVVGYTIEWEKFNQSPAGRDLLYIGRDISVNRIALDRVQSDETRKRIVFSLDQLGENRDLPDLLRDVVRPSRAIAFERWQEVDALGAYPELKVAFTTLYQAESYFRSKFPHDLNARQEALNVVRAHLQSRLNQGETTRFQRESKEKR
jgi:cell filamentation protein